MQYRKNRVHTCARACVHARTRALLSTHPCVKGSSLEVARAKQTGIDMEDPEREVFWMTVITIGAMLLIVLTVIPYLPWGP